MSEELNLKISCLLLKFEYKHLNFSNFKKSIDSLILSSDETGLIEMSLARAENEIISEAYKAINHNIHPKAFLSLISSILIHNSSNDLLERVNDISKYQYSPLKNGQHLSNYYKENKLLEKCIEFFYWSWDKLYLTQIGILDGLKDFENNLLKFFKLFQSFNEDNLDHWPSIESKVSSSIDDIKKRN